MNNEEMKFLEEQDSRIRLNQSQMESSQNSNLQYQMQIEQQEKSMLKDQLDLSEEIERIEHLLKGEVLKEVDGVTKWIAPTDPEMVILTDYGIHLILNTITWYINKNTLLSNYNEELINSKMEDFATALTDVIFMEYEKIFKYPTVEECRNVLLTKLQNKKELRAFSLNLLGKEVIEEEIELSILNQFEGRVEKELVKIREQLVKNKLKRFEIIIREIQDAVHSTYLRALNGQERRTLREHIHISENKGMSPMQQQGGGFFKEWLKPR